MNPGRRYPAHFVALGTLLGLVSGGLVVGVFYDHLVGGSRTDSSYTTTQTMMVTTTSTSELLSTVTFTVETQVTAPREPGMTLQPTLLLYFPGDVVVLVGSIYPPPRADQGIEVATSNPLGTVVQVGTAMPGADDQTFFYVLNAGASASWVSGKYTVTATSAVGSASTVFYYAASQPGTQQLRLQVVAPAVAPPGGEVDIALLATLSGGGAGNVTHWSTLAVYFPDGTIHRICSSPGPPAGCEGALTTIHQGLYQASIQLPLAAPGGTYYVEAAGTDPSGLSADGLAQFSVP